VPGEFYAQLFSIDNDGSGNPLATFFVDARPGVDILSSQMATNIGLSQRAFYLGQYSGGIEFGSGLRISFQYFQGPKQIYQTISSSGATTTTSSRIGGLHLAVSFSPQKSKSKQ
jgi:hypothetical protein